MKETDLNKIYARLRGNTVFFLMFARALLDTDLVRTQHPTSSLSKFKIYIFSRKINDF